MDEKNLKEMPRYKCHKEVHALKISNVVAADNGCGLLQFEDQSWAGIVVTAAFMEHKKPQAGGYFVVYKDGYRAYSPAEPFEDGYTLIDGEEVPVTELQADRMEAYRQALVWIRSLCVEEREQLDELIGEHKKVEERITEVLRRGQ